MLPALEALHQAPYHHEMIFVAGGTFLMGADDPMAEDDERPIHVVGLQGFYLGKYPVTQALWEAVTGQNPSRFVGPSHPVENITWIEILGFIEQLNALTGLQYRLPSEAEWEFAARGGIQSQGFRYAGSDDLPQVAWVLENSDGGTHPVGLKPPNELGLHDLCGNVQEWCRNLYYPYETPPKAAMVWEEIYVGSPRMYRGGGWDGGALDCRPTYRAGLPPDEREDYLGFRLAASAPMG